jgi:hypothetical protein
MTERIDMNESMALMTAKTEVRVIWKYPLKITDRQELEIPELWQPLSVQIQDGVATLWALVDPRYDKKPVPIGIYGTGEPMIDQPIKWHLGTVQDDAGFVWHVFTLND